MRNANFVIFFCEKSLAQIKANKTFFMINKNFSFSNWLSKLLLYNAFVTPVIHYASSVWSPVQRGNIKAIESVQRKATRKICTECNLSYADRLKKCNLLCLESRRNYYDFCYLHQLIDSPSKNLNVNDFGLQPAFSN